MLSRLVFVTRHISLDASIDFGDSKPYSHGEARNASLELNALSAVEYQHLSGHEIGPSRH